MGFFKDSGLTENDQSASVEGFSAADVLRAAAEEMNGKKNVSEEPKSAPGPQPKPVVPPIEKPKPVVSQKKEETEKPMPVSTSQPIVSKKVPKSVKKNTSSAQEDTFTIPSGVCIEGDIKVNMGTVIEGDIKGTVSASSVIVNAKKLSCNISSDFVSVNEGAVFIGDIAGQNVVINGAVKGNIDCSSISVGEHAVLVGNISTDIVTMSPTAKVSGDIKLKTASDSFDRDIFGDA